jgi:hypothetical protein
MKPTFTRLWIGLSLFILATTLFHLKQRTASSQSVEPYTSLASSPTDSTDPEVEKLLMLAHDAAERAEFGRAIELARQVETRLRKIRSQRQVKSGEMAQWQHYTQAREDSTREIIEYAALAMTASRRPLPTPPWVKGPKSSAISLSSRHR